MPYLCKTSVFGSANIENFVRHCNALKNVVAQTKATALLLSNLVLSVKSTTSIQN